jgi:midasin
VQLLSSVFNANLHVVNCHATTEISDLLGGLRPVRGRTSIGKDMLTVLRKYVAKWDGTDKLRSIDLPDVVRPTYDSAPSLESLLTDEMVGHLMRFARTVVDLEKAIHSKLEERSIKRRKVDLTETTPRNTEEEDASSTAMMNDIEDLLRRYYALFEWVNGPLVTAMKQGDMILLDEMSLAEDAVLERLNSVLEPSRTLVLAEKGIADENESLVIKAHGDFQLFATMNPGGDFGKRELSPALRSRFTEIWVPPITARSDIDLVLERSLTSGLSSTMVFVVKRHILNYIEWFNETACKDPGNPCSELSLSMRDILTWARFVVAASHANTRLSLGDLLLHGARLMHLDGLGLGTGLSQADVAETKQRAESLLLDQLEPSELPGETALSPQIGVAGERFGVFPFWIPVGSEPTQRPSFHFNAHTTAVNIQRVLRAMQLSKPVLLEGSPGVGKVRHLFRCCVESAQ